MKDPFRWTLEPQVTAELSAGGGSFSRRRGRFDAVTGASFESAEALVEDGRDSDGAYEILARVTIEGLDLLGLVTADRIVAQVRGFGLADPMRPFLGQEDAEVWDARFTPDGTEIVNLRVLDAPVSVGSDVAAPAGCTIPIADLGVLHLGEYSQGPGWYRLTLVRLELKGRLQGELVAGIVEIGGGPSR
jgi:hypothetical protein